MYLHMHRCLVCVTVAVKPSFTLMRIAVLWAKFFITGQKETHVLNNLMECQMTHRNMQCPLKLDVSNIVNVAYNNGIFCNTLSWDYALMCARG